MPTSAPPELRSALRGGARVALLLLSLLGGGCDVIAPHPAQGASRPAWQVCFSPNGGCTQLVVDTLDAAKSLVSVQAYSFTSTPIAAALIKAHRRGVRVSVILDKSQRTEHDSLAWYLAQAGVPVRIDAVHAIAHNKVMIVDGDTVLTGSFNFTRAAETRNAENLLVLRDRVLAARYQANWDAHAAHAESFTRPR